VNPQNNTARNSHRTPEIIKKFQEAFTHLKSLVQGEYYRLVSLRHEQEADRAMVPLSVVASQDAAEATPGSDSAALVGADAQTNTLEQQQILPEVVCTPASRPERPPAGDARSQGANLSPSLPAQTPSSASAAFKPKKGLQQPGVGFALWGSPLQELPLKPFFFASVDLIEHLLNWREELMSLAPAASLAAK